jgi:hypothetical protein
MRDSAQALAAPSQQLHGHEQGHGNHDHHGGDGRYGGIIFFATCQNVTVFSVRSEEFCASLKKNWLLDAK